MAEEIFQTPTFAKKIKKLHKNQIKDLDKAIKKIVENPKIGIQKKGISLIYGFTNLKW